MGLGSGDGRLPGRANSLETAAGRTCPATLAHLAAAGASGAGLKGSWAPEDAL
jgi:hypothetical protein